jgi:hypothetical protein
MKRFRLTLAVLLTGLSQLACIAAASARDLDDALDRIATRVQEYLASQSEETVAVGSFAGPPSSSAGIRIKSELTERLDKGNIKISKLARFEVRGTFAAETEPTPIVAIKAEMVDQSGATLGEFRERVTVENVEDVVNLLGTTTDLSTDTSQSDTAAPDNAASDQQAPLEARDETLAQSIQSPSFAITGTTAVSASEASPYRLEILLRDGTSLTPIPVENLSGFALVSLKKGQEYVIRLHNASAIDVGVKVTIDGVNTFDFSNNEGFRNLGMWMIPAGTTGTVDGWHVTNTESFAFLVTDVPDSAIAKLQRETTSIGTISAQFFPAWVGDDVPEEELIGKTKGDIGTGLGPKIGSTYQSVARHFGRTLLAAVSIRYEKPDLPVDLPAEPAPN